VKNGVLESPKRNPDKQKLFFVGFRHRHKNWSLLQHLNIHLYLRHQAVETDAP
jgi:hypothetical protein